MMSEQVAILILGIILQASGIICMMTKQDEKQRNLGFYVTAFGFILLVTIEMGLLAVGLLAVHFAYGAYSKQK